MRRLILLVTLFVVLLGAGYWLFVQDQKPKSCAVKRIPCQQDVVCFERTYRMAELQRVIDLLKSRRYTVVSRAQKSEYMASRLFEYVNKEQVDAMVAAAIESQVPKQPVEGTDDTLVVDYLIYENDKLHPGKKTPKSKLYEGYLAFSFKLAGKTVYKFQIDFMDEKGADIPERVKCAIASLLSLETESNKKKL